MSGPPPPKYKVEVESRFFSGGLRLCINTGLGEGGGRRELKTKTVVKFLAELTEADSRRRDTMEPRGMWVPVNFSYLWTPIRWNIDVINVPFANQALRRDRHNFPTPRAAPLPNHFRDTCYPKDVFLRFSLVRTSPGIRRKASVTSHAGSEPQTRPDERWASQAKGPTR